MINHEDCGADYRHPAHTWHEIDGIDRLTHWCDGEPYEDVDDSDDHYYERESG